MSDTESDKDKDDIGELQDTDDDMEQEEDEDVEAGRDEPTQDESGTPMYTPQFIIPAEQVLSSDMLTKYEFAHIVGTRAQQIDKSGLHFADLSNEMLGSISALDVAIRELLQKKCPLLIKRLIDKKSIEILNPNHMILPKVPL